MSLRRQLILVSLLLLTLPWAGCQFIREVEGALRLGQEQAAQATARAIASSLSGRPELLYPQAERLESRQDPRVSLYAFPQREPVIVDGYGDGWGDRDHYQFQGDPDGAPLVVSYQAVTRGDRLYLLLKVQDARVVYHNPGIGPEPNGDRLVLQTWQGERRQEYVIAPLAPGRVHARHAGRISPGSDPQRIRGHWQDAQDGYTLELEMPLAMTGGRLGFYLVNVGGTSRGQVATLGNVTPLDTRAPPWLIYSSPPLQRAMAGYAGLGSGIQVIDRWRWLLFDQPGQLPAVEPGAGTFWLLRALYRSVLEKPERPALPRAERVGGASGEDVDRALGGQEAVLWYLDPEGPGRNTLSASAPIFQDGLVIGAVVVRKGSEEYLSLTDQAFSKLLSYSLLALVAAGLGLLGFASLLSWRIHRLSRAASSVIDEDGAVGEGFPRSSARDEIGELSRHYADLLDRVRTYNEYLRSLSRKLSHELRTPIAVIQSSLENLEQAHGGDRQDMTYINRSRDGLQRLNHILAAMSEATRLEESIRTNPRREVDLVPLLHEIWRAYGDLYRDHRLHSALPEGPCRVIASPELLAQALDKLMENAASFCPAGGEITLVLEQAAGHWRIAIDNQGPALQAGSGARLFEPMVSERDSGSEAVHMGLGLHIVRLIADYHGGQARAENLPDGAGVRFSLLLPAMKEAPEGP